MQWTAASKAHGAGIASAVAYVAMSLIRRVPGFADLDEPTTQALSFLIFTGVTWLGTYVSPANRGDGSGS